VSLFARAAGALAERALTYQEVFGRGGNVGGLSQEKALRLAAVYAASRLLADGLASLPLHEFDEATDGSRTPVAQPSLLVTDPSEIGSVFDWKFQVVTSLSLRGNGYGLPTARDRDGRVVRCEWLHPDRVALDGEDDVLDWLGQRPRWLVDGRPAAELVHLRNYLLPGKILGLSPIGAFKVLIETGLEAQQFGRDWFANGSVPAAVLETDQPIRETDAKAIKQRFVDAAQGRAPVTLGRGVKYRPISVAANESQFLETIAATATTIAAIFGVPAEEIGGQTGGSLTYNTDETRARKVQRVSLRPYMCRLEDGLSPLLRPGRVLRFNADSALRAETLARYQAHEIALRNGWSNVDEVRNIEDQPPLPGGKGQNYRQPPAVAPPPPVAPGGEPS